MPKMGTAAKKDAMIAALGQSLGVVAQACRATGVPRGTHDDWLRHDAEYRARVEECYEVQTDFVESQFFKAIKEGSVPAMIHYLKTKGKRRGYQENMSHEATIRVDSTERSRAVIERLGGADKARKILDGLLEP